MPDVIAKILRPLPLTAKLKGEWWTITLGAENKSGKQMNMVATCSGLNFRQVRLWANHKGMLDQALVEGFWVKSGTPARGFVSALRRAGLAELRPHGRGATRPA